MANGNGNGSNWIRYITWMGSIIVSILITYLAVANSYGSRLSVVETNVENHASKQEQHESDKAKRDRIESVMSPELRLITAELKAINKNLGLELKAINRRLENMEERIRLQE